MPVIYPEGDGLVGGAQVPENADAPDGVEGVARGDARKLPIHRVAYPPSGRELVFSETEFPLVSYSRHPGE